MGRALHPSIDPVVSFAPRLVMSFEAIHSERRIVGTASLNLAHRRDGDERGTATWPSLVA